jgi:hypothetical protein
LVWKNASGEMQEAQVRRARSRSCGPPSSVGLAARRVSPALGLRRQRPSASTAAQRVASSAPGEVDEAHLDLAGAPALADDEVAQEPRSARGPGARPARGTIAAPARARVAALGGEQAVLRSDDLVPAAGAWKPQTSSPSGPVPNEYSSLLR